MKKALLILFLTPFLAIGQALLPAVWNFSTPGISTPPTGWTAGLGTNGNLTYSGAANSVGGDNIACRLDATGEFLTIWIADKPGPLSYWIKGTGIAPNPSFTGVFSVQESVDGNSWSNLRAFTTMTGTMTRYVENPAATTRYLRFFYSTKEAGSNVALDSVVIKSPPVPPLLLLVKQNTSTLISGNTFVSGNAAKTLFTIQNNGTGVNLKIDSIKVSGTHAGDFTLGAFDSTTTFGGGTDTFSLYFNPGASGSRFGQLKIYTSDTERSPFEINLYAIGGLFASSPANQVPSISINNQRSFAFNVSIGKAVGAEKYLVLRKQGGAITEVPLNGVSYKRGDYIGNAQVAYVGNDTATFKPNYILANTGYSFAAFAFNGPNGYENYLTTTPATVSLTTPNGQPGTYYSAINPSSNTFISDLNAKIKQVDTIFYSNYAPVVVNNYLARDTSDGKKVVNCVYTNIAYVYEDPFLWWTGQNGNPATLTREHTFAQSWMPTNTGGSWPDGPNGREYSEYNDLHNLFPAHQLNANAKRSNNPFGIVVNATYTSPTGLGKLGTDATSKTVYEPKDDQKGDLARALFYMLVRFNGINSVQWRLPAGQDINLLLQWHQQDPPSNLEIARNDFIASTQKNRNPFIDNPTWVNRINFSNMTYIPDLSTPTINITAPSAGANWIVGRSYPITWTSQNVDTVVVQYQANDSEPFSTIATLPASLGRFETYLSVEPTTTARYRIVSKSNASVMSTSGVFNMVQSTINVSTPVSNAQWYTDSTYTIKWTKTFTDSVMVYFNYDASGTPTQEIIGQYRVIDSLVYKVPTTLIANGYLLVKEFATNKLPWTFAYDSIPLTIKKYTGIKEQATINSMVQVFPVPSNGVIHVNAKQGIDITGVAIYDVFGKKVFEGNSTTIELLNSGIYFVTIQTDQGVALKKVLIQ